MKKIWRYLNETTIPLFDIYVLGFIIFLPLMKGVYRNIFLVHGSIFIYLMSLVSARKREYNPYPLYFLSIWAMVNMFNRSFFRLREGSNDAIHYFEQQINWSLLNEGFLYILTAIILIKVIVEYSTRWKLYYIPVLGWVIFYVLDTGFNIRGIATCKWEVIAGIKTWMEHKADWSMTPILAFIVALTLTMLRHARTRFLSIGSIMCGLGIMFYKWDYLWKVKWISRPDFWKATIERIIHSPLGYGFYHTINTKDGLIAPELKEFGYAIERWGLGWRQNDFLEITEYLGVIALICIVWFIISLLWKARGSLAFLLGVMVISMCLFQRTVFFPVKAGIIGVIAALLILERKDGLA